MTGNATDAAEAVRRANEDYTYGLLSDDGTSRITYLINGIVYKVDRDDGGANYAEWRNYSDLSRETLPAPFRIPNMSAYGSGRDMVIAADYINGTPIGECYASGICDCPPGSCFSDDILNIVTRYISDVCYGNVINNADGLWLIDLEC